MFYSDLAGSYRLRYRAADALFQISACEVAFTTEHEDAIRVELVWNGDLPQHEHHSFLGMHLLHPNAQRWFDTTLDCWTAECLFRPRDWNQQGQQIDVCAALPWSGLRAQQQADVLRRPHRRESVGDAELRVAVLQVLVHGPFRDVQPPTDRRCSEAD